jgi:tripartite-type tricarboxylate transporter receptor subunit TctC
MAGLGMVHIPYKGGALAVNATISGEVQLSFPTTGAVAPHLKSGRVRALAVTSAQPSALVPGLPTMAASGLPAYESTGSAAIFSTAATPSTVIKRLNQEIVLVLNEADVKERFLRAGVEVVSGSPQQLTAYIKSEIATMGKVIKDAGITGD